MASTTLLLQAKAVTKRFGAFVANDEVGIEIAPGEIHALLGENGAGKSTFVKMVYGLLQPDAGVISWRGAPTTIKSPQHARDLGVGMVFQHFSLFQALSVAENIALAKPPGPKGETLADLARRIGTLSNEYGIGVDPNARVCNLSVGQQQRVEIVRCLMQNPSLLIMDEPTSVLTPQEANQLFDVLRGFARQGVSVLFISHKLEEVRALAHKATVLRGGRNVASFDPRKKTSSQIATMMVEGRLGEARRKARPGAGKTLFEVNGLSRAAGDEFATALRDVRLEARAGEILGIAGIAGNGQDELMDALSGEWLGRDAGVITLMGHDVGRAGPARRRGLGLGIVPEERNGHAAVSGMTLVENALLTSHGHGETVRYGVIDFARARALSNRVTSEFDVRLPHDNPLASSLSGGNLQKFVVGREMLARPKVLVVAQPTWGVDVAAATFIRNAITGLAGEGAAVVVISQDLEEILALSHRVAVLFEGRLSEPVPAASLTAKQVGLMLAGAGGAGGTGGSGGAGGGTGGQAKRNAAGPARPARQAGASRRGRAAQSGGAGA